jgi:hypothetical protein
MILTDRERALIYWLIGLTMIFVTIGQWSAHSTTTLFVSLLAACCAVIVAVRTHLRPKSFTLSPTKSLILIIVCFLPCIIAMSVFLYFRDLSTIDKFCTFFPALLWLGTGIWLAFRSFRREKS